MSKILKRLVVCLLCLTPLALADDTTYVVINATTGGLVKVSSDGSSVAPIASGISGTDVAVESSGNYVVVRPGIGLVRVTPGGVPSTVALQPPSTQWISVTIDAAGNFIVGDNIQHAIWRVSADGSSTVRVAGYNVTVPNELEDIRIVVDAAGNYVVSEGNGSAAHLFLITPAGAVTPVTITGAVIPVALSGLTLDGTGNYMWLDYVQRSVYRITPGGSATLFTHNDTLCCNATGLARNRSTGEYVTVLNFGQKLMKISADGSTVTTLASGAANFAFPESVIAVGGTTPPPPMVPGMPLDWGNNQFGQLGDGSFINRNSPVSVAGLTGVLAIASGNSHTLAIKNDFSVVAWGDNSLGELGRGTLGPPSTAPVPVTGLFGAMAVAAGGIGHSMALTVDGRVWTWGRTNDYNNQIGTGSPTPIRMATPTGVVAIANGYDFYLALKNDGTVWAWNDNTFGQLGNGTNTFSATPVAVNLTGVTAIAAGNDFALALKSDGTVWSWGANFFGSLGNGGSAHSNTPVQVMGLTGVTAIAAGGFHGLAITSDHKVWSWGWNGWGQLGDGTNTDSNVPHMIGSLTGITAIGAGFYHSLALKTDGTVLAFGQNAFGQLGNGTNADSNVPVAVSGLQGIGAIATRWLHSVALPPLPPVTMTIQSVPSGLSFTMTGMPGCPTGSYTTPATLNWPPTGLCNVQFATTQPVVVDPSAPPLQTRFVFTGWSDGALLGSSRTFATPFVDTTITANFKTQYLLSTSASPFGAGSVSGGGYYDGGTTASILATPNAAYQFGNWTGPVASASNPSTTVAMNAPQSVTANFLLITTTTAGPASGQYSDQVTLSATVGAALSGFSGTLQFQVAGTIVGTAVVNGPGTYTTNYTIDKAAGTYTISAIFSSSGAAGSSGTNTLTVSAEDAIVTPAASNPQSFQVSAAGQLAGPFVLTGTVQEAADGSPGDISKAVVTVSLVPVLAGGTTVVCPVVNSAGSLTATCSNVPVSAYTIQWRITGNFYQGPPVDTPLAVYDPSLGFITGSGSVNIGGIRGDFAFSAKYVNNGALTGSLTYTEHRSTGDVTVSATSLTFMALTANTAVISAQATVNGTGNYPIQITVTDNGNPGVNHDQFGLTVTGSPLSPPIGFAPATLTAGNIITH